LNHRFVTDQKQRLVKINDHHRSFADGGAVLPLVDHAFTADPAAAISH
jgi:hypothetical protein